MFNFKMVNGGRRVKIPGGRGWSGIKVETRHTSWFFKMPLDERHCFRTTIVDSTFSFSLKPQVNDILSLRIRKKFCLCKLLKCNYK